MLRTLVGDVTLTSEPGADQLRIGIRWRSGASEELVTQRPQAWRRAPQSAVELSRRLGPDRTDAELAAELNRAGLKTGAGRSFDAVNWLRFAYQIERPRLLAPGELNVKGVAELLGITPNAVYDWISRGKLAARRTAGGGLGVPFTPEVEQAAKQWIANSNHIKRRTQNVAAGGAV